MDNCLWPLKVGTRWERLLVLGFLLELWLIWAGLYILAGVLPR